MAYRIQVYMKIPNAPTSPYAWCDVRPADGAPYEYETREEAESMARLCYDAMPLKCRVVEVNSVA